MTEDNKTPDETVPREQVAAALRFLEWCHGESLRRSWSDEASAYYHAIDIIEAALDEELRPPDEVGQSVVDREMVERSRAARAEGYEAATLSNERFGEPEPSEEGWLSRILEAFV